jgi:uncharacterized protein (TIGR00730 family)
MNSENSTGNNQIDNLIAQMVQFCPEKPEAKGYFEEMLATLIKFNLETTDIGDLKLLNTTLKELRYSFKLFAPYRDVRKVCMFGSARIEENSSEYKMAEDFAKKITRKGFMLITGAGSGVMEAGNKGAELNTSFGVNIRLPHEQKANEYIVNDSKLMTYKYFFNRKVVFIKESDATILFPGGFGTLDEAYENFTLVQNGKCAPRPIVMLSDKNNDYWKKWDIFLREQMIDKNFVSKEEQAIFKIVHDVDEAVEEIINFYRIYNSIKYINNKTYIRLNEPLGADLLNNLNKEFKDILIDGKIEQIPFSYLKEDNKVFVDKTRLVMRFNRKNYGRLLGMIHSINKL